MSPSDMRSLNRAAPPASSPAGVAAGQALDGRQHRASTAQPAGRRAGRGAGPWATGKHMRSAAQAQCPTQQADTQAKCSKANILCNSQQTGAHKQGRKYWEKNIAHGTKTTLATGAPSGGNNNVIVHNLAWPGLEYQHVDFKGRATKKRYKANKF